jgi:hypothetical protein
MVALAFARATSLRGVQIRHFPSFIERQRSSWPIPGSQINVGDQTFTRISFSIAGHSFVQRAYIEQQNYS